MTNYNLVKKTNEGLYILDSKYGQQLFAICKIRKDTTCDILQFPIKKGMHAFRPITNGYNRMIRISKIAIESLSY